MTTALKKKPFILLLAALIVVTFFTLKSETQAAEAWYTAAVVMAGPGWGATFICLTSSGNFTNKYMLTRSDQSKDQLAVALTAISLGKYVMVYADPTLGTPTVQAIYIVN
jgi:hypothetical protein